MGDMGRRRFVDALVSEVEKRVLSRLGSIAYMNQRVGKPTATIALYSVGSVYLGNDTSYASPNFRNVCGGSVSAENTVLCIIDPINNDRYITAIVG